MVRGSARTKVWERSGTVHHRVLIRGWLFLGSKCLDRERVIALTKSYHNTSPPKLGTYLDILISQENTWFTLTLQPILSINTPILYLSSQKYSGSCSAFRQLYHSSFASTKYYAQPLLRPHETGASVSASASVSAIICACACARNNDFPQLEYVAAAS